MSGFNNIFLLMVGLMWISMQMLQNMIRVTNLVKKTCRNALHTANYCTTLHREERGNAKIWQDTWIIT